MRLQTISWAVLLLLSLLISCSKEVPSITYNPSLISMEVKAIDTKSAILYLEWDENEFKISTCGVFLAKSKEELDSSSAKKLKYSGNKAKIHILELETSTEYYVKAFASKAKDTTYSEVMKFTTLKPIVGTAVDLGLSVKWASINVGAASPEGYGDYLRAHDNSYYTNWGDKWRLPTYKEWYELTHSTNCSWTWTLKNGAVGYTVQSLKPGYTDKWIFLPAAGYRHYGDIFGVELSGFYWISSQDYEYITFESTFVGHGTPYEWGNHYECSVRLVSE